MPPPPEVLEEEAADRRVGLDLREALLGVRPTGELAEWQRSHRLDVVDEPVEVSVVLGCDVDHHEASHEVRVGQRRHHRDLAPQRVAHEHPGLIRSGGAERRGDAGGIRLVGELLGPRGPAVVGQVDEEAAGAAAVRAGERLGDLGPVAALAEEAVEKGDPRTGAPDLRREELWGVAARHRDHGSWRA